jgi:hypothetical protein
MKRKHIAITLVMMMLVTSSYSMLVYAKKIKPGIDFSGPHFNLNIHGVPGDADKFKNDSIGSGRHSIFVPLNTTDEYGNPINISIQYAFSYDLNWTVLDCDATGEGYNASIILPAYMYLDTNYDGVEDTKKQVSYYMVYIVGLGKPSEDSMAIIYPDVAHNGSWTAWNFYNDKLEVQGHRKGGKGKTGEPVWYNGTNLFFVDVTFWNGTDYIYFENEWVFDVPGLEGYWWKVTNDGIKLLQVRFYPVFKGNGN